MLAFGTDYEYYNAVWVKNEWSRFLSLIESGAKKTLIPCFKNIDAYDMPREFARLQAQDMGKVGAIQDLLRGVEKILGGGKTAEPVQSETRSAAASAVSSSNVDALLKRVDIFLEDGDWAKAGDFFERVLDLDVECGEAYLGRALAEVHVASLDELAKSIGPETVTPLSETLQAGKSDTVRENCIAYENLVPGFLDEIKWEPFDFSFSSTQSAWVSARELANKWIKQNKNLGRAVQYGDAELRRRVSEFSDEVLRSYDERIAKAAREDEANRKEILKKYTLFLNRNKKAAEEKRRQAEKQREASYQAAIDDFDRTERQTQATSKRNLQAWHIERFRDVCAGFQIRGLANYKDSLNYVEACDNWIATITEQLSRRERNRRIRRIIVAVVLIALLAAMVAFVLINVFGGYL